MIKKIHLLIFFLIALTFSALAQNTKPLILPKPASAPPDTPPGNISLLDGYTHTKGRGYDTSVGEISKPGGMTIRYDIGALAGRYVGQKCAAKDACLWYKAQKINGREVWLGLTKEGQILALFPKEIANFWADTKTPEDVTDFLIMILTYKVGEDPNLQNKPQPAKAKQR